MQLSELETNCNYNIENTYNDFFQKKNVEDSKLLSSEIWSPILKNNNRSSLKRKNIVCPTLHTNNLNLKEMPKNTPINSRKTSFTKLPPRKTGSVVYTPDAGKDVQGLVSRVKQFKKKSNISNNKSCFLDKSTNPLKSDSGYKEPRTLQKKNYQLEASNFYVQKNFPLR